MDEFITSNVNLTLKINYSIDDDFDKYIRYFQLLIRFLGKNRIKSKLSDCKTKLRLEAIVPKSIAKQLKKNRRKIDFDLLVS